jgi:hypothetical protein
MRGLYGHGLQRLQQGGYRRMQDESELLLYGPDAPCVHPDHLHHDVDYHDHHFLLSARDGGLLRQRGLWPGRDAGVSSIPGAPAALSIGHDLYSDRSNVVRVHR